MSAGTFWIGAKLTEWANDWVAYHTGGQGRYVTSAMEDTGTLQSLTWLSRAGRVDVRRVLVLRAGSDHDLPPPGRTAADQLARTKIGQYAAFLPALDAAYRVGSVVVDRLVADWATYRDTPPSARLASEACPPLRRSTSPGRGVRGDHRKRVNGARCPGGSSRAACSGPAAARPPARSLRRRWCRRSRPRSGRAARSPPRRPCRPSTSKTTCGFVACRRAKRDLGDHLLRGRHPLDHRQRRRPRSGARRASAPGRGFRPARPASRWHRRSARRCRRGRRRRAPRGAACRCRAAR